MAYTRHNGIFDKIAWFYNPMSTLFRDSSKYYSEAEHDKATDLSIRELLRTLKKDGVLVIMEFNAGKFGGKMIELLENKLFGMGSRFYHDSEFKTLFNKYSVNVAISSLDGSAFLARITKKEDAET